MAVVQEDYSSFLFAHGFTCLMNHSEQCLVVFGWSFLSAVPLNVLQACIWESLLEFLLFFSDYRVNRHLLKAPVLQAFDHLTDFVLSLRFTLHFIKV